MALSISEARGIASYDVSAQKKLNSKVFAIASGGGLQTDTPIVFTETTRVLTVIVVVSASGDSDLINGTVKDEAGNTIRTLSDTGIYNPGAGILIGFTPNIPVNANYSLTFTYANVSATAKTLKIYFEVIDEE